MSATSRLSFKSLLHASNTATVLYSPLPSLVANFGSFKLLDPSVELAELHAVSAVWHLLDRFLGVHRLSGSVTPESDSNQSLGESLSSGKDTFL